MTSQSTLRRRCIAGISAALLLSFGLPAGMSAAPLAGTAIGNQASATYTDDSGATRTATSNTVITIVQQVAAFTLVQNNTRFVAPGGTVYFPHTVTNKGNGIDSFPLLVAQLAGDDFDFIPASVAIFADADNNGVPDNFTPITTTPNLAAGESFSFVIAATVPGAQVAPNQAQLTVTASSAFDNTLASQTNTDTAIVTADAVIVMTKAISTSSGFPGSGPHTYTLTYTNTGNNTATNLTITDLIPAGMTYVPGSGRWSVTGTLPLTDVAGSQGTAPNTINYVYNGGTTTVTAIISQVAPNQSGSLTFQVNINTGIPPQVIPNTANFSYDPDGPGPGGDVSSPTNTVPFEVLQQAGVVADNPASGVNPNTIDVVSVATAIQGATVTFTNRVVNTGNGVDSFDMTIVSHNFPTGTTFQFFKDDGNTPLIDTNGTGIPDTGPLQPFGPGAANSTYLVVLKVFLPTNATVGTNGGAGWTVQKRATSKYNPSVFDPVVDRLDEITGKTVDLTNNAAVGDPGALGAGALPADIDNAGQPWVINQANPGTTTRFTLYVTNTSATADAYSLQSDADGNFAVLNMHPGWTVVFRNSAEAVITSTGTINSGANMLVYADVTVPSFEPPGLYNIYFRAISGTSGAFDIKRDAVYVNTFRQLSLVSNNQGQTFPGGSVVYSHLLTNLGNVTEGNGAANSSSDITLSLLESLALQGWNSVVYWDQDGNGALDPSDPVITVLNNSLPAPWNGLQPNETVRLFVKVFAPLQAEALTVNVTTLTATTIGTFTDNVPGVGALVIAPPAPLINQDTTTVIKGDLALLKEQALDLNNDGVADGPYVTTNLQAKPGEGIVYRITVTNVGNTDADAIVIFDTTPVGTTYNGVGADGTASVTGGTAPAAVAPANGTAGSFQFTVGTLTPAASAVIKFGVTINPLVP